MKEKKETGMVGKISSLFVYALLAFGSILFVTWICKMAFDNTCVELQEQYMASEVEEIVAKVENSVSFGKEIDNYYGMDQVLDQVCKVIDANLKAVVTNTKYDPLYLSYDKTQEHVNDLSIIYSNEFREKAKKMEDEKNTSYTVESGENTIMLFPIRGSNDKTVAYLTILYDQSDLAKLGGSGDNNGIGKNKMIMIAILILLSLCIFVFVNKKDVEDKWYVKNVPVFIIMGGMLFYIVLLYQTYQVKYEDMVSVNARYAAKNIQSSVEDLVEKGLDIQDISMVSGYINNKVKKNKALEGISIVKNYYDTDDKINTGSEDVLKMKIKDTDDRLMVLVNRNYINDKVMNMTLTFGAIFVICLMVTYELIHLSEIIGGRIQKDFNKYTDSQRRLIPMDIKLFAFLAYTSIYISMPYSSVIMRNWDAKVFGLSKAVSASLPLTIELLCILICSVLIQKIFKHTKLTHMIWLLILILILGNMACTKVSSPYELIGLRAICGIGFAFLKFWLNSLVASGSGTNQDLTMNLGKLNAGLLGGITVGASLGAIMAESLGYQFNYYFTAVICVVVLILALLFLPLTMFEGQREQQAKKATGSKMGFGELLKNRQVMGTILLGDIPLNIGLMYIVAFLPVYMNFAGHSALSISYAYLINGITGVYVGVLLIRLLRGLSSKMTVLVSLALAGGGIFILTLSSSVGIIFLSAAVMGLFDGYGTPSITGHFTGINYVKQADTAGMLTLFNSVGSGVQILCPLLYNLMIQKQGETTYLMGMAMVFFAMAVAFFMIPADKKQEKTV